MQYDAIVVGGGFAGLAAATYLARARRRVCIVDTRQPRNRFAEASHGFLSQDGSNPLHLLDTARDQVAAYSTTCLIDGAAIEARAIDRGFAVALSSGEVMEAGKVILAFGLCDVLPDIPGAAERWGKTVLHCPYCHGIEYSDRPLGVLYRTPMSVHQAFLIAEWGPTTLYLNGAELDPADVEILSARGVAIEPARVRGLDGDGHDLSAVVLDDGHRVATAALYISPVSRLSSPLAEQLGVAIDEGPMGPVIRTDGDRLTTISGVYAAGDIARAPHSISWAVADGVTAGTAAHRAMVFG